MLDVDLRVAEELERLVPRYDGETGDWASVAAAVRRRALTRFGVALVPAVAALLALVLAWPFAGGRGDRVLDRALAAAGDGSVVHAVFRESSGETVEAFYHRERGLVRVGGASMPVPFPDFDGFALFLRLTGLSESYRDALADGRARVLGDGAVDGVPVHWIAVGAVWTKPGEGPAHVWELEVAVSRDTYKPVAMRGRRDGEPWAAGTARILLFETLPADAVPTDTEPRAP